MIDSQVPTPGTRHGPPSRANERLSNLVLEGGKSQAYPRIRRRDVADASTETPAVSNNNGTDPKPGR